MSTTKIPSQLADVRVIARVSLPATAVALDQLGRLEPGTLVHLRLPTSSAAELTVNGQVLAEGEVVATGESRGIAITELM